MDNPELVLNIIDNKAGVTEFVNRLKVDKMEHFRYSVKCNKGKYLYYVPRGHSQTYRFQQR